MCSVCSKGRALLRAKASAEPDSDADIFEPERSSVPQASATQLPKAEGTVAAISSGEPPAASAGSPGTADGGSVPQPQIAAGGPRVGAPDGEGEAPLDHAPPQRTGELPAAGGAGEGGTGGPPTDGKPRASIDSGSAEGLLASLGAIPVSDLGQALASARTAAVSIQEREKAAAQAAIPAIDQPTGLPAVAAPRACERNRVAAGQAPESKPAAGPGGPAPGAATSRAVRHAPRKPGVGCRCGTGREG